MKKQEIMKVLVFICSLMLLFSTQSIYCQPIKPWQQLVDKDDHFYELVEKVDAYFDQQEVKDPDYKHYMRWKGEIGYHVDPSGNMPNVNVHRLKAIKQLKSNRPHSSGNRAYHGNWTSVGPSNYTGGDVWSGGGIGRINCMAFHPTDINTFYVGAANGGLWKTSNYGMTWTPLTDNLPTIGISGIVIVENSPNTIYILTGDGDGSGVLDVSEGLRIDASIGVLKSIDGGATWQQTGLNFLDSDLKFGYDLAAHPTIQSRLLAAMGSDGIYRTTNGGTTWTRIDSNRTVWDLEFSEDLPDLVFAASDQGLLKSVNGGTSFSLVNVPTFPTSFSRMSIALSPSQSSSVYAVFGGGTGVNGTFKGLYKSEDFGASFALKSNSPNILGNALDGGNVGDFAWFTLPIVVDPDNDNQIFVAGVNMWKSQNSGTTWSRETWSTKNFEPIDPYVHADWHNMYFRGSTLFANTDGGIAYSNDFGNDWSELTAGLAITQIYEINMRNDAYLISAQDNGVMQGANGNTNGHQNLGGDGFACAWHPNPGQDLQFISTQDRLARRAGGSNIFIWQPSAPDNGFWYTDLKFHTDDYNYIFFDKGNELFRASENTSIFDYFFDSLKTNSILTSGILGFSQGSWPYIGEMYVIDRSNIIRTSNLSFSPPTWSPLSNPALDSANLSDILMSPESGSNVWLTCSGYNRNYKVFYSGNGGLTWANISAGLPNVPTRCIAFDPGSNNGVYLGTDIGVFYKNADMPEWVWFSIDFPQTAVVDIEVSNGSVYAGTYGRGLWRSDQFSACPPSLILTQANDPNPTNPGTQFHSASNFIFSSRILPNSISTNINYRAGNQVDLLTGFEAKHGAFFEVKTGDCPN